MLDPVGWENTDNLEDQQRPARRLTFADGLGVFGLIGAVVGVVFVILVVFGALRFGLPAYQQRREESRRAETLDNLKKLGLELHKNANADREVPAAGTTPPEETPARVSE